MIEFIIPLVAQYWSSGLFHYYFVFLIGLAFVACVPFIIKYFWRS